MSLSLLVHELATNAIKYGSLSNEVGRVSVRWSVDVLKDEGKTAPMPAVKKQDMTYPIEGGTQPVRIYTPENAGSGPLPVIVYYHGGGWVIANIDTYESSALALASKAKAIVVSVEYRHAPEAKFPAAHEDSFAAYKWALEKAASFGGDPAHVAVAGESAGGNLAANVAIMARDQKVQMPLHMLLVYPVAGTDMNTPSYIANQNAMPLSKGAMGWFVGKVLAKPEDAMNPMLNLTTKADLKGLPPATIITAEIDPLMSDGVMLAEGASYRPKHNDESGSGDECRDYTRHEVDRRFRRDPHVLGDPRLGVLVIATDQIELIIAAMVKPAGDQGFGQP
jgi:acetyl esterase/lipase